MLPLRLFWDRTMLRHFFVCLIVLLCILRCAVSIASDFKVIALTGSSAPGGPGTQFASLGLPLLNDVGRTAFTAQLSGPTVDSLNQQGIWSDRSGAMSMIVRTGQAAPGTTASFKSVMGDMTFNNHGQIAFRERGWR